MHVVAVKMVRISGTAELKRKNIVSDMDSFPIPKYLHVVDGENQSSLVPNVIPIPSPHPSSTTSFIHRMIFHAA
jgi:hypothetical protein